MKLLAKLINKCLMLFILLSQPACSSVSDGNAAIANFQQKFKQEIAKEYGLTLYGAGASFPVKIEAIILCFQADYRQDVRGARKLAVEITNKMIARMNQDENLLKYLANHPANIENVNLTIAFRERNARSAESLDSVMVIGVRNKIVYNIKNESGTMLETLLRETFDEAKRIVTQESL